MDPWAKIGYGVGHRYAWKEVEPDGAGGWREVMGGRSGTTAKAPAIESARNERVPQGSVVRLHEMGDGEQFMFWYSGEGVSWG